MLFVKTKRTKCPVCKVPFAKENQLPRIKAGWFPCLKTLQVKLCITLLLETSPHNQLNSWCIVTFPSKSRAPQPKDLVKDKSKESNNRQQKNYNKTCGLPSPRMTITTSRTMENSPVIIFLITERSSLVRTRCRVQNPLSRHSELQLKRLQQTEMQMQPQYGTSTSVRCYGKSEERWA